MPSGMIWSEWGVRAPAHFGMGLAWVGVVVGSFRAALDADEPILL